MTNLYHILNGESLKAQFPKSLTGEVLVARECLVDGEVDGDSLEELFATRAKFISSVYENYTEADYIKKTVSEFEKIRKIPAGAEINLWFEDDLFCQVNLWFTIFVLTQNDLNYSIYLIRPKMGFEYNFGGMSEAELITAFQEKLKIEFSELEKFRHLSVCYQQNNRQEILKIAKDLADKYSFLLPAIKAHLERERTDEALGRPQQTIVEIIEELQTDKFGLVFQEFCRRESIYGFGDLQVKRMFDEVLNKVQKHND